MEQSTPTGDEIPKPLLRGWLHLVAGVLVAPVAIWLVARPGPAEGRAAAAVYAVGLVGVLGVSATYHRGRWGPVWRRRLQCADHATIFVMIAGTYTPICLLVLDGWFGTALLITAWSGAALGAVLAYRNTRRSAWARSALYIALGWAIVIAVPQLVSRLDGGDLALLGAGGLLFTVGAISFATRWPDPLPRHFGYHEVWHVFVVAAITCQLLAVESIVRA